VGLKIVSAATMLTQISYIFPNSLINFLTPTSSLSFEHRKDIICSWMTL